MKRTAQLPVIGMDIAKNVFQIHIVDPETGEIERIKLKRDQVSQFFANRQPALVAMEACGLNATEPIGIGGGYMYPLPCHTTRHAGPHRAVREVEVNTGEARRIGRSTQ